MDEPVLSSEELQLRIVSAQDLEAIHDLHSRPETDRYNTLGIPASIKDTQVIVRNYIEGNQSSPRKFYTFSIFLKTEDRFIGLISLNPGKPHYRNADVWYKILPEYWGNGYATRAMELVLDFGFRALGLHRIEAGTSVNNTGSIRVMEKVGMVLEGTKRKNLPLIHGWEDNHEYAILEEEWKSRKN